ncbi:uncharacterized protein [Ptychodera flava]|uniref:uncharacterized protein n=1 Tax=Ptychodera flava TaxID=63121 RepID=UPI003969FEAE
MVKPYLKTFCYCLCLLLYCPHTPWYTQCRNYGKTHIRNVNTCEEGEPCSEKGVVLFVGTEWQPKKTNFDIVLINRELAKHTAARGFKIYCTVYDATKQEEDDASRYNIDLLRPELSGYEDIAKTLTYQDLLLNHQIFYPSLGSLDDVKFIISHANFKGTSKAASSMHAELFADAKFVPIFYSIPESESLPPSKAEYFEREMEDYASSADIVLSLGSNIYDYFEHKFKKMGRIRHHLYLPDIGSMIEEEGDFKAHVANVVEILTFYSDVLVQKEMFQNFEAPAKILGDALRDVNFRQTLKLRWKIVGVEDNIYKEFQTFLRTQVSNSALTISLYPPHSIEKLFQDLSQCHFLLYLEENTFGMPAFLAASAGIPVLASEGTGFAAFVKNTNFNSSSNFILPQGSNVLVEKIRTLTNQYQLMLDTARETKVFIHNATKYGVIAKSQQYFLNWLDEN